MPHRIVMPSFGMYTAEGTVGRWLVPAGARVAAGQPVVELLTEKASYEVEAPADGVLHPVLAEGANVTVEGLIGWILAAGEAPPADEPARSTAARPTAATNVNAASTLASERSARAPASPAARRLAQQMKVDLGALAGSGPGGRITEADVLAAAKRPAG